MLSELFVHALCMQEPKWTSPDAESQLLSLMRMSFLAAQKVRPTRCAIQLRYTQDRADCEMQGSRCVPPGAVFQLSSFPAFQSLSLRVAKCARAGLTDAPHGVCKSASLGADQLPSVQLTVCMQGSQVRPARCGVPDPDFQLSSFSAFQLPSLRVAKCARAGLTDAPHQVCRSASLGADQLPSMQLTVCMQEHQVCPSRRSIAAP